MGVWVGGRGVEAGDGGCGVDDAAAGAEIVGATGGGGGGGVLFLLSAGFTPVREPSSNERTPMVDG